MPDKTLNNYIGRDISSIVDSLYVRQGTTKDGATYCYLSLTLTNGYEHRIFLRGAESFAWINAIDLDSTSKHIDVM